jgi:opacity protein-like surface antigen
MPSLRAILVASVAAVSFTAPAGAADMPRLPPTIRTVIPDTTPTWYLRADLGYRTTSIGKAYSTAGFPELTSNSMDGRFWGGIGGGFKFDQFRTDLTVDFSSEAAYSGAGGTDRATAQIQSSTALANLYYDIGTLFGITPYIGAGVGVAYTKVSNYQSTTVPPLTVTDSNGNYSFAWALMAGASYQFMPRVSVDLGYRFLDQGAAVSASDLSGQLTLKPLQSHEMRIGIRWTYEAPSTFR